MHDYSGVLDLRHLRLIEALHKTGNMTRAAAMLHLTQSALSHQLKDVEEKLGMTLFVRESRRMTATAAGERLIETCQRVLSELSAVEREIRTRTRAERVRIRISTGCYTCYHWLPPRIRELRQHFPSLDVDIVADYTRRPIAGLVDGAVDVAVVSDKVRGAQFTVDFLFRDELVAVVAADDPLASRSYLDAATLATQTLVLYNVPDRDLSVIRDVLAPARLRPREIKRVELTEGIIELVRAGIGVTCLAQWAVRPHLRDGRLKALRLTRKGFPRTWSAVTRKADRQLPHIQQFIRLLQREPFA